MCSAASRWLIWPKVGPGRVNCASLISTWISSTNPPLIRTDATPGTVSSCRLISQSARFRSMIRSSPDNPRRMMGSSSGLYRRSMGRSASWGRNHAVHPFPHVHDGQVHVRVPIELEHHVGDARPGNGTDFHQAGDDPHVLFNPAGYEVFDFLRCGAFVFRAHREGGVGDVRKEIDRQSLEGHVSEDQRRSTSMVMVTGLRMAKSTMFMEYSGASGATILTGCCLSCCDGRRSRPDRPGSAFLDLGEVGVLQAEGEGDAGAMLSFTVKTSLSSSRRSWGSAARPRAGRRGFSP